MAGPTNSSNFLKIVQVKWCITLSFIFVFQLTFGQGPTLLDKSANPGEVFVEFDYRTYDVKGSYYLFEDWQKGDIELYTGTSISDQSINYNTENDMLEVMVESQVKVIPVQKIYRFTVKGKDEGKRFFIPGRYYILDEEVPLAGICEVVDSGYYGLLIRYSSDVKEATYVPELDMGKKEDEIIIIKKYYLSFGTNVCSIPKKKALFISLYEPHGEELESYMKEHKLNHRKVEELQVILSFLNDRYSHL